MRHQLGDNLEGRRRTDTGAHEGGLDEDDGDELRGAREGVQGCGDCGGVVLSVMAPARDEGPPAQDHQGEGRAVRCRRGEGGDGEEDQAPQAEGRRGPEPI